MLTVGQPTRRGRRSGRVSRPRLVRRLVDAGDVPLALVVAPAGYGKTTILCEWVELDERPDVWLTLSPADDDRDHLLASIAGALERQPARPCVLVLDDAQVLRDVTAVQALGLVPADLGTGSTLALAT